MPSTVVSSFQYFPETSILRVIFVSGMVYDYLKVPEKIYQEMKGSSSKGTFLNEHIKKLYEFRKVR